MTKIYLSIVLLLSHFSVSSFASEGSCTRRVREFCRTLDQTGSYTVGFIGPSDSTIDSQIGAAERSLCCHCCACVCSVSASALWIVNLSLCPLLTASMSACSGFFAGVECSDCSRDFTRWSDLVKASDRMRERTIALPQQVSMLPAPPSRE